MTRLGIATLLCCLVMAACAGSKDEPDFVVVTLGASDATGAGAGAVPTSDGYVSVMGRELQERVPGLFLINLGVAGARIDQIIQQVLVAEHLGTKADVVTVWTGSNDLIHGDDPKIFQQKFRMLLRIVRRHLCDRIIVGNLPELTRLPRLRAHPAPAVTEERVTAFNRAISEETASAGARLVDFFSHPVRDEFVSNRDGLHPNNAGHREIARLFLSAILPQTEIRSGERPPEEVIQQRFVRSRGAECRQTAWSLRTVCS